MKQKCVSRVSAFGDLNKHGLPHLSPDGLRWPNGVFFRSVEATHVVCLEIFWALPYDSTSRSGARPAHTGPFLAAGNVVDVRLLQGAQLW